MDQRVQQENQARKDHPEQMDALEKLVSGVHLANPENEVHQDRRALLDYLADKDKTADLDQEALLDLRVKEAIGVPLVQ